MTQPVGFEMPAPELYRPGGPLGESYARYRCPAGCGWSHDERTDVSPTTPLTVRDLTAEGVAAAVTALAGQRQRELQKRVMYALAQHMLAEHLDRPADVPVRPKAEFPYLPGDPRFRVARFRCPHTSCDWSCDADTNLGPPTMKVAPGESLDDAQSEMISRNEALVATFWATVEGAIAKHLADAHPQNAAAPL
ncbi:hypothetical protein ACFY0G_32240 [Streptomyces sp. NPDC001552]|uniref:hypothetical protein n=1 Tax=Streptomyces sp. NPDC001552 TaxID=3364587 RepID=UPI0036CB1760